MQPTLSEESYYGDMVNVKCDCCGKMIPRKPFVRTVQGKKIKLCDRDCYDLYLEYRLNRQ